VQLVLKSTVTGMGIVISLGFVVTLLVLTVCSFIDLLRFKNVQFEISSTDTSGTFDVNAKFMGVSMDKVDLVFQVLISDEFSEEAVTERKKRLAYVTSRIIAASCVCTKKSRYRA
jgi:hypothetical protein